MCLVSRKRGVTDRQTGRNAPIPVGIERSRPLQHHIVSDDALSVQNAFARQARLGKTP
jgi:hypothetical protein